MVKARGAGQLVKSNWLNQYLLIPTCLGEYENFGEILKLGEERRAMTKCGAQYSQTSEGINLFFK